MIYGYNSRITERSVHTIPDYTDSFLEELRKARRQDNEKNRPVIFIGHSFGGIIIAHSIVKAKDYERRHGPIFASTKAAIFFGTPHRGLVVDDILAMLGHDSAREGLVMSIDRGSRELESELKRFIDYSMIINLKIVSFTESAQTRKLVKGTDGQWSRRGPFFTAVERGSSMLQLPDSIEESLAVEGDHSTMVKFKYKGHMAYTSVIGHLERFTLDTGVEDYTTVYSALIDRSTRYLERILQIFTVNANKPLEYKERTSSLPHVSAENGASAKAPLPLIYGANTETWESVHEPLYRAAILGDEHSIKTLLKVGLNVNAKRDDGATALHLAATYGAPKVARVLLENGADTDARWSMGMSALHVAAGGRDEKMVETLLASGANVNVKQVNGMTPLHIAAFIGTKKVLEVLLENGADIDARSSYGFSALHIAAERRDERIAEVLLRAGADINAKGGDGLSPLHAAALRGAQKVVEILLENGVDIDARSSGDLSALYIAATAGDEKIARALLRNGADVNGRYVCGFTALHIAAAKGYERVVELLLQNGADTTIKYNKGFATLPLAAGCGHEEGREKLLEHGADIDANSVTGYTAFEIATMLGRERVCKILARREADVKAAAKFPSG